VTDVVTFMPVYFLHPAHANLTTDMHIYTLQSGFEVYGTLLAHGSPVTPETVKQANKMRPVSAFTRTVRERSGLHAHAHADVHTHSQVSLLSSSSSSIGSNRGRAHTSVYNTAVDDVSDELRWRITGSLRFWLIIAYIAFAIKHSQSTKHSISQPTIALRGARA
jgi:hypothetical protein